MRTYYRASHILVSEEDDIQYILDELHEGKKFSDLAKEYSECDSAEKGGSLGRFPSGSMVAEFEKALYQMKEGEIKGPIKTKFGYHIIFREKES